LEIRSGTSAEQLEQVLAHRLDAALVAGPVNHPELHCTPVFREELVLVSSAGSRSIEQRLARGELSAIVFRAGCTYRHCLESLFAARGWTPYQRLEFGTLDGILGCVAADVGVSLLPRSAVESFRERDALRIEGTGKTPLHIDTLFVRRADAHSGAALQAFLHSLLAAGGKPTPTRQRRN
jgi:DNA-binding transcriptional LysR family regulator